MKISSLAILAVALRVSVNAAPFTNLDFESLDPGGVEWPDPPIIGGFSAGGPADRLAPGWSFFDELVHEGTLSSRTRLLTDIPPVLPGFSYLSIIHTFQLGWEPLPLQGRYALHAAPKEAGLTGDLRLIVSQSGLIPEDARSLHFLAGWDPWDLHINDIRIPLIGYDAPMGRLESREIIGDVSAFAGREVELKFITRSVSYGHNVLDGIRFSPEAVPEPAGGKLLLTGATLWALSKRRRLPLG